MDMALTRDRNREHRAAIMNLLSSPAEVKPSTETYINVIHNEFMKFDGIVEIPRIPVSELDLETTYKILEKLYPFIGYYLKNKVFLSRRNPPSEQHSIHLARPLSGRIIPFCHILRLDMKFSGDPSSITEKGNSNLYPAYRTDRVYLKSRIVPLQSWNEDGSFIPLRLRESTEVESDLYFHTYAMFDDVNTGDLTRELCSLAGNDLFPFSADLYPYLVSDYFTACLNILEPDRSEVETGLDLFEPLFLFLMSRFRTVPDDDIRLFCSRFPDQLKTQDGQLELDPRFRLVLKEYFSRRNLERDDDLALKGWWRFTQRA